MAGCVCVAREQAWWGGGVCVRRDGHCSGWYASYWNAFLLPPTNEVWGKVIFFHLSLILFTKGGVPGQVPPGRYTPWAGTPPGQVHPWQVHPQAGTRSEGTSPQAGTPLAGTPPKQVHPPGRYPLAGTPPRQVHPQAGTPPAMHAGIRSTSGRYASHWNAFLFKFCSVCRTVYYAPSVEYLF